MIHKGQNSNFKLSNISNIKQQSQLKKLDKQEESFKLACNALLHSNFGRGQNLNTIIDSLSKFDNTATNKLVEIALEQFKIANSQGELPSAEDQGLVAALLFIKIASNIAFTQSLTNLDQDDFNKLAFNNWCKQELKLNDLPNNFSFSLTNRTDGACLKFNLGSSGPLDMPLATFLNKNQQPKDNFMTTFKLKELTTDIDTIDIYLNSIKVADKISDDKQQMNEKLSSALLPQRKELQNKLASRIDDALLNTASAHKKFKNFEEIAQNKKVQVLIAIQSGQLDKYNDLLTLNLAKLSENTINEIGLPKELFHELVNTLQTIKSNEQVLQLNSLKNMPEDLMAYSQLYNANIQANKNDLMAQDMLLLKPQKNDLIMEELINKTVILQNKVHDLLQKIFPEEIDQLNQITNDPEFSQAIAQSVSDTLENKLSAIKQCLTDTIDSGKPLVKICENLSSKDKIKSNDRNVLSYLNSTASEQLAKSAKRIIKDNPEYYSSQGQSISANGSVIRQENTAFNFNNNFKNNQVGIGNCYLIAFLNSAIFNSTQAQKNIAQRVIINPTDGSVTIKINLIKEFRDQNGKLKDDLIAKLDATKFTKITSDASDIFITISHEHVANISNYGNLIQTLKSSLAISDPANIAEDMLKALAQFAKQAANHLKKFPELQKILSNVQNTKTISRENAIKLNNYGLFQAFFHRVASSGIGIKLLESTLSSLASIESELRGEKDLNQSVLFFSDREDGKSYNMDHIMYSLMGYNVDQCRHNVLRNPNKKGLQSKIGELEAQFAKHNEINKPIAILGMRISVMTGITTSLGSHTLSIVDIQKDDKGGMWLKLVNPWDSTQAAQMPEKMKKGMKEEIKYGFEDYWSLDQIISKSNANINKAGNPEPGSVVLEIFSELKN